MTFDTDFYLAMLRTSHNAGIEIIPRWRAAQLMAILQVFGNNESFAMSPKFKADCQYIQETYHINGGEVPDKDFADDLKYYIERYEAVKDNTDPYFVAAHDLIKDRYNFKLYV